MHLLLSGLLVLPSFAADADVVLDAVRDTRGWRVEGPTPQGIASAQAVPLTQGDGLPLPELEGVELSVGRARKRKVDRLRVLEARTEDSTLREALWLHWQNEVERDAEGALTLKRTEPAPGLVRILYTDDGERIVVLIMQGDDAVIRVDLYACPRKIEEDVVAALAQRSST